MFDPLSPVARPYVATPSRRARRRRLPGWRAEALRASFWLVPAILVVVAVLLFAVTFGIDFAAFHHHLTLPFWIRSGDADTGRAVLVAIAAAIITVVGVVFSITILALTLASQQFGPRMMRTFMRDLGTQVTLGIFVGTCVYAAVTLGFTTATPAGPLVPHLSIATSEVLLLVDLGVLIYFVHHIATSIQLPQVMATIADDLMLAIESELPDGRRSPVGPASSGRSRDELVQLLDERGAPVPGASSGYLQFVAYRQLVRIASELDCVVRLAHRPGHFVVAGRPLATVWPAGAADQVRQALARAHLTGPHRTLNQDPVFAIDQLVEIAIRALSPAVNDTFTALTCIDWLTAGLCLVSGRALSEGVYRDDEGRIRLIEHDPSYERMVDRAFDKVRQAGRGMPAVLIRLIDALTRITEYTVDPGQRVVLRRQAERILRGAERDVDEPDDLAGIRRRYDSLTATGRRLDGPAPPSGAGPAPTPDGATPAEGRPTAAGVLWPGEG